MSKKKKKYTGTRTAYQFSPYRRKETQKYVSALQRHPELKEKIENIRGRQVEKYQQQEAEIASGKSRAEIILRQYTPSEKLKKGISKVMHKRMRFPKAPSAWKKRMTVRFAPPTENSSYLQGNYLNNPSDKPMLGWTNTQEGRN